MDQITKEYFTEWAAGHNWLLVNQSKSGEGFPQDSFVTPAGQVIYIIYTMDGKVRNVAIPMAAPIMNVPPQQFRGGLPNFLPPLK